MKKGTVKRGRKFKGKVSDLNPEFIPHYRKGVFRSTCDILRNLKGYKSSSDQIDSFKLKMTCEEYIQFEEVLENFKNNMVKPPDQRTMTET